MYEETLCKLKRKLSEYKPFILMIIWVIMMMKKKKQENKDSKLGVGGSWGYPVKWK